MDHFYLHLYCGDSRSTHIDNHAGDFTVNLSKTFHLEGRWECALTELTIHPQTENIIDRLYICTDAIVESYTRNSFLPLLRSIEPYEKGSLEFSKPYYVRVRPTDLNCIRVFIRDDRLHPCRFKIDRLYCTLHFRKKQWGV